MTVLVALAVATPAGARPCAVVGNLVQNCGFTANTTTWVFPAAAGVLHVGDDGASALGCVAIDAAQAGNFGLYARSACIDVTPSTGYGVGATARLASGVLDGYCDLSVSRFLDDACQTPSTGHLLRWSPSPSWREIYGGHVTGATTQSVEVWFTCNSSQDFVMRLDDFLLVPAIFVDGFGTIAGTTNNWSVTVN